MGIKINDEKMKERIKESKKDNETNKTEKKDTIKKLKTKETDEKDDGTYKYKPFEIFFNKKKEEKNETKTE